jgi:type I restriction enzyme, R subunit
MIGRGTRLRPDLFEPGQPKEFFYTPLLCFALSGFSVVPSGPISHTLM